MWRIGFVPLFVILSMGAGEPADGEAQKTLEAAPRGSGR